MESLLISNARRIRAMNQNGVKKMFRNILALQQNIKIIAEGLQVDFDRAKRYYALFTKSPPVCTFVVSQKASISRHFRIFWMPFASSKSSRSTNTRRSSTCSAASTPHKENLQQRMQQIVTTVCM